MAAAFRYLNGTFAERFSEAPPADRAVAVKAIRLLQAWSPRLANSFIFVLVCLTAYLVPPHVNFALGSVASLYVFSAILQAYTALLAITGAFVIFRFQSLDQQIERREDRLSLEVEDIQHTGIERPPPPGLTRYNARQLIMMLDDVMYGPRRRATLDMGRDAYRVELVRDELRTYYDRLRDQAAAIILEVGALKQHFRRRFVKPLVTLTLTVVAAAVALPVSENLHHHPTAELAVVTFVVLVAVWATLETVRFIWESLQSEEAYEGEELMEKLHERRAKLQQKVVAAGPAKTTISQQETQSQQFPRDDR